MMVEAERNPMSAFSNLQKVLARCETCRRIFVGVPGESMLLVVGPALPPETCRTWNPFGLRERVVHVGFLLYLKT